MVYSFLVVSLSGFGITVMLALQSELGNVPSSSVFWKSLRKISISSLNIWWNSPKKLSGPGLYFWLGEFWLLIQSPQLVIGLLIFSVSSWDSLGKFCVSSNLSISSRLSNLLAYTCLQYSLIILSISVELVVISLLSFLILVI